MCPAAAPPLGSLGVWILRYEPREVVVETARAAERLGYGTIWISGGVDPGVFDLIESTLAATERITVAVGVVNLWAETPQSVTDTWHRAERHHPGRLYVGLGISHGPLVKASMNVDYRRPLARTKWFLDELDRQPDPLPDARRLIGALGPRMTELAAERTLGTHPYLVSPRGTAEARAAVGTSMVAPELGVILQPDLRLAHKIARESIEYYLELPNYRNSWLRTGFSEEDFSSGASDRLIESLFAMGDVDAIATRVAAHRAAGADHVALQILGDAPDREAVLRDLAGT